ILGVEFERGSIDQAMVAIESSTTQAMTDAVVNALTSTSSNDVRDKFGRTLFDIESLRSQLEPIFKAFPNGEELMKDFLSGLRASETSNLFRHMGEQMALGAIALMKENAEIAGIADPLVQDEARVRKLENELTVRRDLGR